MNSRGSLVVPDDERVLFVEPAIVVRVKADCEFYLAAPLLPKNKYNNVESTSTTSERQYYKIKTSLLSGLAENDQRRKFLQHHTLSTSNSVQLKKGDRVLSRAFEFTMPDPKTGLAFWRVSDIAREVTVFQTSNDQLADDLPESGRGVEIGQTGYVFKENLKEDNEYYIPLKDDIFPPNSRFNVAEVQQTVFGDCYLLAAIASIIATGNGVAYFSDMMRQDNYFTTVRLFNPKTNEPTYVKVANRIFCEGNDNTVQHMAPWIHMLEKAYAGFAYKKGGKNTVSFSHSSFRAIYGDGGHCELAFKILTGQDAKRVAIHHKKGSSPHPWSLSHVSIAKHTERIITQFEPESDDYNTLLERLQRCFDQAEPAVQECFGTLETFRAWTQFLIQLEKDDNAMFKQFKELSQSTDELSTEVSIHQANEVVNFLSKQKKIPGEVAATLLKFIHSPVVDDQYRDGTPTFRYPGAVEDACYTREQLDLFDHLKQLILDNHLVTAATKQKFKRPVLGLRNKHVYSVLDARMLPIDGKQHFMLKLRNPWGKVGRHYCWDKVGTPDFIIEDEAHAEFWLDINEFTKYFNAYFDCQPIPGLCNRNTHARLNQRYDSKAEAAEKSANAKAGKQPAGPAKK